MIKIKQLIKESPDNIKLPVDDPNRPEVHYDILRYEDSDAIGFLFDATGKFWVTEPGKSHVNLPIEGKSSFEGRVWTDSKFVTFWEYPKTSQQFRNIAKLLKDETGINILGKDWKIEVDSKGGNNRFIPTQEYGKVAGTVENPPESEKLQHLMSPTQKAKLNKEIPAGWGSKKMTAGLSPTEKHQMKSTSENIKEWADQVKYKENGKEKILNLKDPDAIPFVYRLQSKKTFFGPDAGFHDDIQSMRIFSKSGGSLTGRLWTDTKIISLWDYPNTKPEFRDMIDSINDNNRDFKIDSSWKIDIPKVASNYYENDKGIGNWPTDKEYTESYFIPVFDWTPNIMKNPSLYNDVLNKRKEMHTLSPIAKKSDVYAGVGSKKTTSGIPQIQKYQMASTSEGLNLNEWADMITYKTPEKDITLEYDSSDALPFIYIFKLDTAYTSEFLTQIHSQIPGYYDSERNETFIAKSRRRPLGLSGRIWANKKVISFWDYPDSVQQLKKIIDAINKSVLKYEDTKHIKVEYSSKWKIDIPKTSLNYYDFPKAADFIVKVQDEKNTKEFRDVESILIPLTEWTPNVMKNPIEYEAEKQKREKQHMMSPVAKSTDVTGDVGSKKTPAGLSSTQRHQLRTTSESK